MDWPQRSVLSWNGGEPCVPCVPTPWCAQAYYITGLGAAPQACSPGWAYGSVWIRKKRYLRQSLVTLNVCAPSPHPACRWPAASPASQEQRSQAKRTDHRGRHAAACRLPPTRGGAREGAARRTESWRMKCHTRGEGRKSLVTEGDRMWCVHLLIRHLLLDSGNAGGPLATYAHERAFRKSRVRAKACGQSPAGTGHRGFLF
jgi:hypothetical protein